MRYGVRGAPIKHYSSLIVVCERNSATFLQKPISYLLRSVYQYTRAHDTLNPLHISVFLLYVFVWIELIEWAIEQGNRFPCESFFQSILDFMAIDQCESKTSEKNREKTQTIWSTTEMYGTWMVTTAVKCNIDIVPIEWIKTSRSQTQNRYRPFKIESIPFIGVGS